MCRDVTGGDKNENHQAGSPRSGKNRLAWPGMTISRTHRQARDIGKEFPVPDGYIAAIAAAKGFQVASRDTAPFYAAGVSVISPWELAR